MPYAATPVTTYNWEAVYTAVNSAVMGVVRAEAIKAFRIARNKAPVRKVFGGGRQKVRTLTAANIRGEQTSFRKAFPETRGADLFPERSGTKIVVSRNRQNMVSGRKAKRPNTLVAREVFKEEHENFLRNPYYNKFLSSRGRYELKTGRAIFEPQEQTREEAEDFRLASSGRGRRFSHEALRPTEQAKQQLGGALRDSIDWEDESEGSLIKFSVVAGNERVKYAKYVEFGTRHAPAQPFLRPALAAVRGEYARNVRLAIRGLGK